MDVKTDRKESITKRGIVSEKDIEILEMNGWDVDCKSPLEIAHRETGDVATGLAAKIVLKYLKDQDY